MTDNLKAFLASAITAAIFTLCLTIATRYDACEKYQKCMQEKNNHETCKLNSPTTNEYGKESQ